MSKLLRYYKPGQIYFITSVTYKRKPILIDNADVLINSIEAAKKKLDFELLAHVILPVHIHLIMDPRGNDLSSLIKRIKLKFSYQYKRKYKLHKAKIWQPRFWDHIIRNEKDMNNHIDYIHYNPVKHGLINRPADWKYSSFNEYLSNGKYENDWGIEETIAFRGDYGE